MSFSAVGLLFRASVKILRALLVGWLVVQSAEIASVCGGGMTSQTKSRRISINFTYRTLHTRAHTTCVRTRETCILYFSSLVLLLRRRRKRRRRMALVGGVHFEIKLAGSVVYDVIARTQPAIGGQ